MDLLNYVDMTITLIDIGSVMLRRYLSLSLCRKNKSYRKAFFGLTVGAALCLSAAPVMAQEWSGNLGVAYLWQDVDGNEDSFRSQTDLQEGFFLEDLQLRYRGKETGVSDFKFGAWGFGDANPAEAARFELELAAGYSFGLEYDKRTSYFNLGGGDLQSRDYNWDVTRLRGSFVIDAWKPIRFSLLYRTTERDGTILRPTYGLNQLYPAGVNYDEKMSEATLRLETRTLPVRLELEQSLADYERRNRPFAAGETAIDRPEDPDLLQDLNSGVVSRMDRVPTTRLVASYSSVRFEGVASLLWRSADLDVTGTASQTYLIGGGSMGTTEFIDTVLNSATQDTFSGALSFGFLLADRWTLRLTGNYRDGSTDSKLLSERMIRTTNPAGDVFEITMPFDDSGIFDFTDSSARLVLEYRGNDWSFWAGGGAVDREIRWRLTDNALPLDGERDGTTYLAGASWNPGDFIDVRLEFERGDFEKYVFRTDPETVDRTTLKIGSQLGGGWRLDVHGRHVAADNPPQNASLDSTSTPYGIACSWASDDGSSAFGLDLEHYSLESETALVLPGGETGLSVYDLDLMTATLHGLTRAGSFGVSGSLTYLTDDGTTWPVDSFTGWLRFTLYGKHNLEYSALAQYWSYDEGLAEVDDFDVIRYGLALNWRFE